MISCATTFQKRRKRLSAAFFWKTAASDRKWLNITDLDAVKPDPALFPGFNDQLRHDFSKEAEAFISSILLEDRSVRSEVAEHHRSRCCKAGSGALPGLQ